MILFDLQCPKCSKVFEAYLKSHESESPCPDCGTNAHTIISPVRSKLDGTDPGFPGAYDKWARLHEQAAIT